MGASSGELGAVEAAREKGIPTVIREATPVVGVYDKNLGTGVYSMTNIVADIVGSFVNQRTLQNKDYAGGIGDGWADFAYQIQSVHQIPAPVLQKIEDAKQKMREGTWKIPFVPTETPPDWNGT